MEDNKKQLKSLNLVESVIQIIKKENSVVPVLEKTVSITKGATACNQDKICRILSEVLSGLKDCKTENDLDQFENSLRSVIFPKELRSLEVDKNFYELLITFEFPFGPLPKVLSMGEASEIIQGRTRSTQKLVALKKPITIKASKLILNEAIVMSKLKHPNILPLLGFQKDGIILITPFMSQTNMGVVIHQSKNKISTPTVLKYLIGVSKGMEYLSENNIIHRNLRLENVLIDGNGDVKICDFKYAQNVGNTHGVYRCNEDLVSFNISPESFSTKEFRTETDVYAMGLLIWDAFDSEEMLSSVMKKKSLMEYLVKTHAPAAKMISPSMSPKALFQFVTEGCLLVDYKSRPSFKDITKKLEEIKDKKQY